MKTQISLRPQHGQATTVPKRSHDRWRQTRTGRVLLDSVDNVRVVCPTEQQEGALSSPAAGLRMGHVGRVITIQRERTVCSGNLQPVCM